MSEVPLYSWRVACFPSCIPHQYITHISEESMYPPTPSRNPNAQCVHPFLDRTPPSLIAKSTRLLAEPPFLSILCTTLQSSSASVGLADYSQVDIVWYKFDKFGAEQRLVSPNL